jgi:TrmH family RNA methyltransferase
MRRLSQTVANQGLVAIAEMKEHALSEINSTMRILILDRLQDPGNIGTAIRNAVAFGFDAVVFLAGCGDPWNDKVVRASAGTLFYIRMVIPEQDLELVTLLSKHKLPLVVSALENAEDLENQPWLREPLALVIGNEGQGVADWLLQVADYRLKIPMTGPAESLNAGVAAGILLYHMQK